MTPAGRWAIEHADGYGYQVFHPTPEQENTKKYTRRGTIEHNMTNSPIIFIIFEDTIL